MSRKLRSQSTAAGTGKTAVDFSKIKDDFPVLRQEVNGHKLVYLDSAATSQKPRAVIEAHREFYQTSNANIKRGLHTLSERATAAYERTRSHVASFIGGVRPEQIIFTRSATESVNLVAYTWGMENIRAGDEIVVTEMEHHANFVPWVILAQRTGAKVVPWPITPDGFLDMDRIDEIISPRTKLVAVTQMSNVLGTINPVAEIVRKAHEAGAIAVVDGAQAAPHLPLDIKSFDPDFYVFSSHKMLGPTGVGVLYGRTELLEKMSPFNFGGEMILEVGYDKITFDELPHKFEAGTPAIAEVAAFDTALTYLETLTMDAVREHEMDLTGYAIERLIDLGGIEIQGPADVTKRGAAISFTDTTLHPHDISTFLDSLGIAIRAGHHCAQPLMKALGKVATARASLYVYNDKSDIDRLCEGLVEMRRYFGV
jgi:cysteine desulfurase/selenocysteine lyase